MFFLEMLICVNIVVREETHCLSLSLLLLIIPISHSGQRKEMLVHTHCPCPPLRLLCAASDNSVQMRMNGISPIEKFSCKRSELGIVSWEVNISLKLVPKVVSSESFFVSRDLVSPLACSPWNKSVISSLELVFQIDKLLPACRQLPCLSKAVAWSFIETSQFVGRNRLKQRRTFSFAIMTMTRMRSIRSSCLLSSFVQQWAGRDKWARALPGDETVEESDTSNSVRHRDQFT